MTQLISGIDYSFQVLLVHRQKWLFESNFHRFLHLLVIPTCVASCLYSFLLSLIFHVREALHEIYTIDLPDFCYNRNRFRSVSNESSLREISALSSFVVDLPPSVIRK